MPISKKVKLFDPKKLTPEERDFAIEILNYIQNSSRETSPETQLLNPPGSGLLGTDGPTLNIDYDKSPNEKIIQKGDAYITFGTDKPSGPLSGKSRAGALRAPRVDLVVGRMAGRAKPANGSYVGNSFEADAARIYISALTDIDKNFGVAEGKSGELKNRSGIGIKADGVRIIGREGVKIVTGRMQGTNEKNSLGGKLLPAPTIELIAGNNPEPRVVPVSILSGEKETYDPLQGVAMGDNTVMALKEISELLTTFASILKGKEASDALFDAGQTIAHQIENDAIKSAFVTALMAAHKVSMAKRTTELYQFFIDKALWDINYLEPFGYRFIESRNVKTT
jgi:hypothetical protein